MRSSEIPKSLSIKPLLLRIKRFQLRWLGDVSRMPQQRLTEQGLLAKANGKRLVRRPIELNEPTTMTILDGIVWDFTQAK